MGVNLTLTMVRVSVLLVLALFCIAASAKKPSGGNKPNGNKPNGNKPNGNKPNGNKPNGGGNKPKPVTCDVATNFPCLLFGQECVEGNKGPTCQKPETILPAMPPCTTTCEPPCFCIMAQCFCPPDVTTNPTALSMSDLWKTLSCASDAVGTVKSKACKQSCMMEDSDVVTCSTCVVSQTDCLAGVAGGI